jgi:excisionase family DNA binding protein
MPPRSGRVKETGFFSVAEAGEALGVSPATVWRLIRSGALGSVKRGGRRLVPSSAVFRRTAREDVAPFDLNHPIFRLAGAGRGGGSKPGAREKHRILDR